MELVARRVDGHASRRFRDGGGARYALQFPSIAVCITILTI